jgi:hypothetical protein
MVAATAAVLLTSSGAFADVGELMTGDVLTPERRARLDPAQHPGSTLQQQDAWDVTATREGAVPGLPGNRHHVHVVLHGSTGYPADDDAVAPRVDVDLVSEQCTGGECTAQLGVGGTVLRPPGLRTTSGGPAGVTLVITDATPGVEIRRAPGVPALPLRLDLTIVPAPPPFDTAITFATVQSVNHDRGPDGGTYVARNPVQDRAGTASGTAFGIALGAGDETRVTRFAQLFEALPPTAPVRTAAERRPYVPRVADGRIADATDVGVTAVGSLARQPVTSTGRAFPGNRTFVSLSLSASAASSFLGGIVVSFRCAAADTPYEGCTALDSPRLVPRGRARVLAGPDGTLAATQVFDVVPPGAVTPDPAWGTIRLAVAARPGRDGALTTSLAYLRNGDTAEVSGSDVLAYTAGFGDTARQPGIAAAVGTAVLLPITRAGDLRVLRYAETFAGTVPAPQ